MSDTSVPITSTDYRERLTKAQAAFRDTSPTISNRRVDLRRMSFRRMVLWLQHFIEQWLRTHDETHAERPAWGCFMPSG